jgi:hypothetical protein
MQTTHPTPFPSRGYVFDVDPRVPSGFTASLERRGLAAMTARTLDGLYLEPRAPFGSIVAAFDSAGLRIRAFHAAGNPGSWRSSLGPTPFTDRLRNRRAAEWLPTLPPAG